MTWKYYPQEKPQVSGYYNTIHYHEGQTLYKAFWYNVDTDFWLFRYDPDVKGWYDLRHDYYVPCQMQEGVPPPPKDMLEP